MTSVLKANELLYLSMLCGANEIFGIPDIFHGKSDEEITVLVKKTSKACFTKGLIRSDFEGIRRLDNSVEKAISLVSAPSAFTELIIRKSKARHQRYLIYSKGKDRTVIFESGGEYFITENRELLAIHTAMFVLFANGCLLDAEKRPLTISCSELSKMKTVKKQKSTIMRTLMKENGADEITASLIAEGMTGRAGYFSATKLDILDKDIKTAFFLADSGVILRIESDSNHGICFSAIDSETALQTALSFWE